MLKITYRVLGGFLLMAGGAIVCEARLTVESGLVDYQVYQRSNSGTATIDVGGTASEDGSVVLTLKSDGLVVEGFQSVPVAEVRNRTWKGTVRNVPTGGPYSFEFQLLDRQGIEKGKTAVRQVLVGDLWLLAGQSNMQGIGNMVDVEAPSDRVNVFRMSHQWDNAVEPLHRLFESVDPVHLLGKPRLSREEADLTAEKALKGAGLGLAFAKRMVARTGVPVGLVPAAHGATSMDDWDPDLKNRGGASLYGSMLSSLKAVGGHVAGVLWYQGESDAGSLETAREFPAKFIRFVESIRRDNDNPDTPFYYVQIGRYVIDYPEPDAWNLIREHQRVLESQIPFSGVVASVDLPLDDPIHVGTQGLKILGARLANLAVGETARGPRFDRIEPFSGGLRVVFKEVNGRLLPKGRVSGFSIRNASGEDLHLIYKQRVDPEKPHAVLLYTSARPPKDARLYYGYGTDPFCNLRDSENMAALAMGPISIPEK